MEIDRRKLIASLGGLAAVSLMDDEAKADVLEDFMSAQLDDAVAKRPGGPGRPPGTSGKGTFPNVAEIEAQIETRSQRRGVGSLFASGRGNVKRLEKMPTKPTLVDYYRLRFAPANHVLQSATLAMKNGMDDEIIFACLIHDVVLNLVKPDHGWWGAQLFEPYVSEKVAFAVRYHQTLRYFPDPKAGYEYPDLYRRTWGADYVPPPYIQETYRMLKAHKNYMWPRLVTVNDLYAFDPNAVVAIDPFIDIIGRQFKQPKEGLGFDNSPVAHMWRTISTPDNPL